VGSKPIGWELNPKLLSILTLYIFCLTLMQENTGFLNLSLNKTRKYTRLWGYLRGCTSPKHLLYTHEALLNCLSFDIYIALFYILNQSLYIWVLLMVVLFCLFRMHKSGTLNSLFSTSIVIRLNGIGYIVKPFLYMDLLFILMMT
jgi:hypothetical protein